MICPEFCPVPKIWFFKKNYGTYIGSELKINNSQ